MCCVKNWKLPRPESLAWYIAVSALRMSVSASDAVGGIEADADRGGHVQVVAVQVERACQHLEDLARTRSMRRDDEPMPGITITNSSPPTRETVSPSRTHTRMRLATACSSRSPSWWPSESLMVLKRSRSRKSTASCVPLRCAWAIACWRRSRSSTRLGSPVSASWCAMCATRCSAILRSVMFIATPIRRCARPSGPRCTWPRLAIQCTEPSGQTTRKSAVKSSACLIAWRSRCVHQLAVVGMHALAQVAVVRERALGGAAEEHVEPFRIREAVAFASPSTTCRAARRPWRAAAATRSRAAPPR